MEKNQISTQLSEITCEHFVVMGGIKALNKKTHADAIVDYQTSAGSNNNMLSLPVVRPIEYARYDDPDAGELTAKTSETYVYDSAVLAD